MSSLYALDSQFPAALRLPRLGGLLPPLHQGSHSHPPPSVDWERDGRGGQGVSLQRRPSRQASLPLSGCAPGGARNASCLSQSGVSRELRAASLSPAVCPHSRPGQVPAAPSALCSGPSVVSGPWHFRDRTSRALRAPSVMHRPEVGGAIALRPLSPGERGRCDRAGCVRGVPPTKAAHVQNALVYHLKFENR